MNFERKKIPSTYTYDKKKSRKTKLGDVCFLIVAISVKCTISVFQIEAQNITATILK